MLKLIIFVVAGYFLYHLFANDFFRKNKENDEKNKAEMERKARCGEMVKDPECGVYVEKESSISVRNGEQIYYFCSYECRDEFIKKLKENKNSLPLEKEEGYKSDM